jgi:hypothetical protein
MRLRRKPPSGFELGALSPTHLFRCDVCDGPATQVVPPRNEGDRPRRRCGEHPVLVLVRGGAS